MSLIHIDEERTADKFKVFLIEKSKQRDDSWWLEDWIQEVYDAWWRT